MLFGVGHVGRQMIRGSVGGAGPPGATLDLSFMNPGVLDPRITFTRAAGPATYFDSGGVMRTAAVNQWLWSADASNAAWSKGGVGASAAPVVTGNQTAAPDGTTTAARVAYPVIAAGANGSVMYQAVTASASAYTFSVWLKGAVGGEQLYLFTTADTTLFYRQSVTLTTAWQRFTLTTPNLTAATWYFQIGVDLRDASQTAKPAQTVYVWGAQVEQGSSASPYIPTTTAANGAPRWDYDPVTLALKGLLIEEARTNSYRNGQFTGGTVGTPGTPPTNVTFFAPSGTVVASVAGLSTVNGMAVMDVRFAGNVTGGALRVYFDAGTTAAANAQAWTLAHSIALVAGTLPAGYYGTLALDMTNAGSTYLGSLTSNQLDNPTVTLTRQSAVATLNQATTAFISTFYQASMNNGAVDFTLRFTMPQLELGAFPTSYIPTTAAVVTRSGDVCSMPVWTWYQASPYSLAFEIYALRPDGTAGGIGDNAVPANAAYFSGPYWFYGGGTAYNTANTPLTLNAVNKQCGTINNAAMLIKLCWNAQVGPPIAMTATPAPGTVLAIGTSPWGVGGIQLDGHIRRIRYWPRVLSDAEMQSVTT